jgi:hypothetical protein
MGLIFKLLNLQIDQLFGSFLSLEFFLDLLDIHPFCHRLEILKF